jgi:hypothetical protein
MGNLWSNTIDCIPDVMPRRRLPLQRGGCSGAGEGIATEVTDPDYFVPIFVANCTYL